jgi:hypothetical protein
MTRALPRPATARIRWKGASRLIPSRYPSVGLFDRLASPEDFEALVELEAWTNDRLSTQLGLLHAVPREEWAIGQPMASVVMAAFCHPRPGGARFSPSTRGAWYAARSLETALTESIYHRTRELSEVGHFDTRMQMRLYQADVSATFHDIRTRRAAFAACYSPDSYVASQSFAAHLLSAGSNGLVYQSVRHQGGECIACFRPRLVSRVRVAAHYEFQWDGAAVPQVRKIS